MSNQELFVKLYEAHIRYEQKLDRLAAEGVNLHESVLTDSFYLVFDIAMDAVLTPEGSIIFYDEILFRDDYTIEEILTQLQEYFI